MVVTKNVAPFNSNVKRFAKPTTHPSLDPSGLYLIRPDACDPCLYHPIRIQDLCEKTHAKNIDKDPWRYKSELEEWAQNLGYRNQKILEQRRWQNSLLGPAWTELNEPAKYESACPNVGFGRTSRNVRSRNFVPGPGTYYKAKPFKVPYGPHSTRPTFDREEPCRFKDPSPKWSLAPDRYRIIDKESIAEKSNKLVSLRGPYDLFTGKRDGTSIKNHFNRTRLAAATWPIALKGTLDKYSKSRFGEMNKTGRDRPYRGRNTLVDLSMCLRKPEDPGPGHYDVCKPRVFRKNPRGFNSSYDKPPGYMRTVVWPGVGRYRITDVPYEIEGNGHKHVFLSKLGRTIGAVLPQPMNTF
ncbi:uncharacterized protein LOC142986490 [Anticarsia gemmatalis]|uniref:uncharacterized protein LOC142986490 n=1 Tax=Anticarsia gemmatalis TaxID=129554 RepID=UPI003F774DA3